MNDHRGKSILERTVLGVVSLIIPKVNPDFDKHIDEVEDWLVEYDMEGNFVNREIGLDKTGKVIMITPWKNNYGYWIDNYFRLNDFSTHFNIEIVDSRAFGDYWRDFENENLLL